MALVRQNDYEEENLISSIRQAINLSSFDISFVRGKNVLLKPNLLGAYPPQCGVTTNPSFLYAAIRVFAEAGATVLVGDSPNGIFEPELCWKVSGLGEACLRAGARKINFEASGVRMIDGIAISAAIFEADFLINLPKFKTHSLTALTVCTKNLFGCVPGMMKTAYHRDNPDGADFVRLIVKLSELVRPALNLVDAIEAMEGDGPSAGRQIKISAILAGTDHHRVDAVCAKIAGVEPADVDTLRCAAKLDLWNASETIKIVGEDVSHFIKKGFKMPATFQSGALKKGVSKFLKRLVWPNLSSQPEIAHDLCVKCQLCVKSCPVAAISPSNDSFPEIDKDNCIQCFCCHEICPHRAIYLRQSLLTRLGRWYLSRTAKKGEKR